MEHKVRVPECAPLYNVFSLYQPPQKPRSKMIMPMLSLLCGMHGFTAKSSVPRLNISQILMTYMMKLERPMHNENKFNKYQIGVIWF